MVTATSDAANTQNVGTAQLVPNRNAIATKRIAGRNLN